MRSASTEHRLSASLSTMPSRNRRLGIRRLSPRHAFDLPPTYTLIYAPRDADEVASVMRILDAAIAYMTRDPAPPTID